MAPISTSTEIDRSADDVFAYAIDPTRFHEWQKGVVEGHMDQPGVSTVGARCLTTRRIGGANRPSTSEVTNIDPPSTWGVRGIDGPIRAIVDLTVEPVTATRSRLTIAVDFTGHGVGKLLVPLIVRREARREMPSRSPPSTTSGRPMNPPTGNQTQRFAQWCTLWAAGTPTPNPKIIGGAVSFGWIGRSALGSVR